jgi:hypothetical protein
MKPISLLTIFVGVVGTFVPVFAHSQTDATPPAVQPPKANPARPTFTNPATLPPVSYLQFEQGIVQANTSPGIGHQFSIGQTVRLAVHPRLMLEFLSQPFAFTTTPDGPTKDAGDLDAAVQGILLPGHALTPTVAVGYQHVLRSGSAPNLDIGSPYQSVTLLVSGDIGATHYDTNYIVTEQTNSGPTLRRAQFAQTLSVSHPIFSSERFGITGELWHFTQPLPTTDIHNRPIARANAVGALASVTYTAAPILVLDIAVDHGLTSTSTQWQAIAGFTYLLPHRLGR